MVHPRGGRGPTPVPRAGARGRSSPIRTNQARLTLTDLIHRPQDTRSAAFGPVTIGRDDPRYPLLSAKGANKRFSSTPESFRIVGSTEQVVAAVTEAARSGRRVVARSGGHCYEDLVGTDSVDLVVDLSEMDAVYFDSTRNAFAVEAGAKLLDLYRKLHLGWGVTIPGGASAGIAAGGHVSGGGFGALARRFGISVDHLYAVEVVVADRTGQARAVIATREPDDPNRELWWAHTGAGGGNFGVVTRYWFRSPDATGTDPSELLPKPPATVLTSTVFFPREAMDRDSFRTLVRNFSRWHELNSDAGSPYAGLFSGLILFSPQTAAEGGPDMGAILFTHMGVTGDDTEALLDDFVAKVTDGGPMAMPMPTTPMPWLASVRLLAELQDDETNRQKVKSSYLRRSFTDTQIDTIHDYLNRPGEVSMDASVSLQSYGGAANLVPSDATAVPQRDSVMRVLYMKTWTDPTQDTEHLDFLRSLYRDLHRDTGGVPVPGPVSDGCFINFLDTDLADERWNTSGVPWHDLYYGQSYPRLQAVKATWDPGNVFHHALSVRADGQRPAH